MSKMSLFSFLAIACTSAFSAQMASQQWVTNRIAEAEARTDVKIAAATEDIPPSVSVVAPSTNATEGTAADAKATGTALYTGFTEWVCDEISDGWTFVSCEWDTVSEIGTGWFATLGNGSITISVFLGSNADSVKLEKEAHGINPGVELSRHLITPKKTSQLTNDSGFLTQHQDISGKLDGAAAYPAWSVPEVEGQYHEGVTVSYKGRLWQVLSGVPETTDPPGYGSGTWTEVCLKDLKQDTLSSQQIGYIDAVPGKADKVANAAGNLAALDAHGNLADSGAKASDFATPSDIPYRLVEPGAWEFSGVPDGYSSPVCAWDSTENAMKLTMQYGGEDFVVYDYTVTEDSSSASFSWDPGPLEQYTVTATRASLPGHLLDRAVNSLSITSITNITLPALSNPGHARDFILLLDIPSSITNTVPAITNLLTFTASGAETVHYYVDGDDPSTATFPLPTSPGTWSYSFSEFKASWFAVSLKPIVEAVDPGGAK